VLFVLLVMVNEIMRGWNFVSLAWRDGKHSNEDPFLVTNTDSTLTLDTH